MIRMNLLHEPCDFGGHDRLTVTMEPTKRYEIAFPGDPPFETRVLCTYHATVVRKLNKEYTVNPMD